MWRFIAVTFAFLGFAFYQLSGGADYEPRQQSLQVQAKLKAARPEARPSTELASNSSETLELAAVSTRSDAQGDDQPQDVTRAALSFAELAPVRDDPVRLVLASGTARSDTVDLPTARMDTDVLEQATLASLTGDVLVSDATAETGIDADQSAVDIRQIKGKVVNMRMGPGTNYDRVGKLNGGTDVEVLQNPGEGWLKIRVVETQRVGWMADFLVTAAVN